MGIKIAVINILLSLMLFLSAPVYAVELKAFGDATFGDSTREGDASGFTVGQLDLWATQKIDTEGKSRVFLELVVESPGSGFVVDLERLWVEYALTDMFKMRAGRFHTSLGYWNRAYHHGAHIQTTVSRPLFLDFEDGSTAILPTHMVGVMAISDIDSGIGGVHFELQAGNGSSYNGEEIDPNNVGDIDDSKGVAARLVFSPEMIEGLGIGFSFIANNVRQKDSSGLYIDLVDQKVYEADIFYVENNVEFIFEHYWIANKDTAKVSRTSSAWYVQGGYTLFDLVTPYVRYEYFENMKSGDPYFITLGSTEYHQTALGARFDILQNSSVKLEGRFLDESTGSSESYWMQWTFAF